MNAHMPEHPVEVRGQLSGVISLLSFAFQGLDSGYQGWEQAPLLSQLYPNPLCSVFIDKFDFKMLSLKSAYI